MNKSEVTLEFSESQLEIITNEAELLGMTVEEWLKYNTIKKLEELIEDEMYGVYDADEEGFECNCGHHHHHEEAETE